MEVIKFYRVPHLGQNNTMHLEEIATSQVKAIMPEFGFIYNRITHAGYMSNDGNDDPCFATRHELKKDGKFFFCYTLDNLECEKNRLDKFISIESHSSAYGLDEFIVSLKSENQDNFLRQYRSDIYQFIF